MTGHLKEAHGIAAHVCAECGKSFPYLSRLKEHIDLSHKNIKNFQCTEPDCAKAFGRKKDMERHVLIGHAKTKDYVCHLCGFATADPRWLPEHVKRCSGVEIMSAGEYAIKGVLEYLEIPFVQEHSFADCKVTRPLRFDFYLPSHNAAIEFDGRQHFEPVEYWRGQEGFEATQRNDAIKNAYCIAKEIPLLRIKWTEFEYIHALIEQFLATKIVKPDHNVLGTMNLSDLMCSSIDTSPPNISNSEGV